MRRVSFSCAQSNNQKCSAKQSRGDWLKVAPAAKRQFSAAADSSITYVCIQVKENSGSSWNLGGRAAWGRVCGRAKLGAGTLRCLHLCWRLPWDWSDAEQLGRCPKPHKGRCPLTLQGALPLDPSARLSWSRFHAPSACSFLGLRLSPWLLPQLSVKNQNSLGNHVNEKTLPGWQSLFAYPLMAAGRAPIRRRFRSRGSLFCWQSAL